MSIAREFGREESASILNLVSFDGIERGDGGDTKSSERQMRQSGKTTSTGG
jgi:hypothetical protein